MTTLDHAALEARWIAEARTYLTAGDVPGAVNVLRHAVVSLAASEGVGA